MLAENEQFINSGEKIRDLIIDYLEELTGNNKHVNPKLDGRIK
jgi:hypothetical protein